MSGSGPLEPVLDVRGLSLRLGSLQVLTGVDLSLPGGEIWGLIGPNGAGKTSLFNCVSGHYRATAGRISVLGVDTGRLPPQSRRRLGLARTFQQPVVEPQRSVVDNVLVGGHLLLRGGVASYALGLPRVRRQERRLRERALELLADVGLAGMEDATAGELGTSARKRLELARALLGGPRLLLLDEPAAGLGPRDVAALGRLVLRLRAELGLTVLVIEHHLGLVGEICDRVVALVGGQVVASGRPAEVQRHPDVVAAYVGAGP